MSAHFNISNNCDLRFLYGYSLRNLRLCDDICYMHIRHRHFSSMQLNMFSLLNYNCEYYINNLINPSRDNSYNENCLKAIIITII